jgi:hypothetical protein
VPSIIVVADTQVGDRNPFPRDRRMFQLKERVRASDVNDSHLSAQLMQRIGWALADAEAAELTGTPPDPSSGADAQSSAPAASA